MSYQYPYIEHYSPSPATSTPQQPFAQWADVQDEHAMVSPIQQPNTQALVQEQDQQQQMQQQVSAPTYEAPQVIQLVERPLRRAKLQQQQQQALQAQNQNQAPNPASTTTQLSNNSTSPSSRTGVWFDLRDSSSTGKGKDVPQTQAVRQALASRTQARLASHPYHRRAISGDVKVRRERESSVLVSSAPNAATYTVMACGGPSPASANVGENASTTPSPLNSPLVSFGAPVEVRRLLIRTDVHCDVETSTMTVMLELPGVKKADLSLSLGSCPYSRVRQLTVRGRSGPAFADEGYTVRERKYGEFKRVLVVPPETKPSDIKVSMEDGILNLRFPAAAREAEPQEYANIPIV